MRKVTLLLDDGTKFQGYSFGAEHPVAGEVVFNTAMSGYPESLTDPSYAGQLLTLTYPLIGNYGVPPFSVEKNGIATYMESDKIYVRPHCKRIQRKLQSLECGGKSCRMAQT